MKLCDLVLALALLAAACAPQSSVTSPQSASLPEPSTPRRITVAITGNPTVLSFSLIGGGGRGGVDALEELVHAGLSGLDHAGELQPRLGEAVPAIENGLWRLLPDGRMETTWRIRQGAVWHDGTPVTSDDLLFTASLGQNRDTPMFGHIAYRSIERLESIDARTVTVHWRGPFIGADTMFTRDLASPLPRHLLEPVYASDKANILQAPYWNREFIGAGPFKVQDYVEGSHMVLAANDRYVLGRPKLDEVVVRFIPDVNTLLANVLAGEVQLTMGFGLSLDQAIEARQQWKEGSVDLAYKTWILMHPQLINPNPPVIADAQFRRGLVHALDRQQMVESLQYGLVPIAHSPLNPNGPEHREAAASIVRYDYDPRRAAQHIEGLGYSRGPDGLFYDSANQRLSVEIIAGASLDITVKSMLAVADYWQRAGIATETVVVPQQRARDREYHATRRGFELTRTSSDLRFPPRLHSREVPLPENNFVGSNNSRYANPEYDALVDRYSITIAKQERTEVVRQIIHHLTDRVIPLGLFFDTEPALIANRLQRVAQGSGERSVISWNAHDWDIK